MLFRRREPASWREKLRVSVWPRRSWARSSKYVTKRVLRLTASQHAIAAGVAAGVFTSFTPFMGFHFIIAALVAYIIGGNMIASALGTFFGNPLTFPAIWLSTYSTGKFILHGPFREISGTEVDPATALKSLAETDFMSVGLSGLAQKLVDLWEPILFPMFIGGIPLGIGFGIAFYLITRWALSVYRGARDRAMAERTSTIRANSDQAGDNDPEGGNPSCTGKTLSQNSVNLEKAASSGEKNAEAGRQEPVSKRNALSRVREKAEITVKQKAREIRENQHEKQISKAVIAKP